jgi:hypothetical protein
VSISSLFTPSAQHDGVRPIHVWLLRLISFLAGVFVATWAWGSLLRHEGPWDPYRAVALCVWAAYPTLLFFGMLHPVRMLPLILFTVAYKAIFLALISYPAYQAGTLSGTTLQFTKDFLWLPLALVAIPWGYVVRRYFMPDRRLSI